MPVTFTAANNSVAAAPTDLITSAALEAGILGAGETLGVEDAPWILEKLQRLIDKFNAQRGVIFNHSFSLFNLQANHAPHTIGPGGDFQVAVRPIKILSASFVLNGGSSNPVDLPVRIRDDEWWAANPLKSLSSSIVTDLFYDPAMTATAPYGNLNFYPISTVAAPVRLEAWFPLPQAIDYTTKLGLPQAYWDAIVLSLALSLCPSYNKQPSAVLVQQQQEAMKIVRANNEKAPRIDTNSGMPSSGGSGRPDFNFLTGMKD